LFHIRKERKVKIMNHGAEILDLQHPHDNPKKMSRVNGADLMVRHLGVTQAVAVKNCNE